MPDNITPMKLTRIGAAAVLILLSVTLISCASADQNGSSPPAATKAQTPTWTDSDLQFFLHGSMSTEFVPETVLRAFIRANPDLFPNADLRHVGLVPDASFGW